MDVAATTNAAGRGKKMHMGETRTKQTRARGSRVEWNERRRWEAARKGVERKTDKELSIWKKKKKIQKFSQKAKEGGKRKAKKNEEREAKRKKDKRIDQEETDSPKLNTNSANPRPKTRIRRLTFPQGRRGNRERFHRLPSGHRTARGIRYSLDATVK